jgi:hypothetical protein
MQNRAESINLSPSKMRDFEASLLFLEMGMQLLVRAEQMMSHILNEITQKPANEATLEDVQNLSEVLKESLNNERRMAQYHDDLEKLLMKEPEAAQFSVEIDAVCKDKSIFAEELSINITSKREKKPDLDVASYVDKKLEDNMRAKYFNRKLFALFKSEALTEHQDDFVKGNDEGSPAVPRHAM